MLLLLACPALRCTILHCTALRYTALPSTEVWGVNVCTCMTSAKGPEATQPIPKAMVSADLQSQVWVGGMTACG